LGKHAFVEEQMRCVKEHVPQLRRIMRSQLGMLNLKLAHTKRKTL